MGVNESRQAGQQETNRGDQILSSGIAMADEIVTRVGERLQESGTMLKQAAPELGPLSTAATTVGERLEGVGLYLQETNPVSAIEDLTRLIRRYPIHSLLLGFGLGYALARIRWGRSKEQAG